MVRYHHALQNIIGIIKKLEMDFSNDYKLYKGAWVANDPLNEVQLADKQCVALLNRGGI